MIHHEIFGVRVDDLSKNELIEILNSWLKSDKINTIFTPNPEFILLANKNPDFAKMLNQSDLSLADGVGLRFGIAALTNNRLKNRQTGVDTLILLARLCGENNKRLLLFGGTDDAAIRAKTVLLKKFPDLKISTINPGYLSGNDQFISVSTDVWNEIKNTSPDVIAVALGQGKQERFIVECKKELLNVKIYIGVGGSFNTIAGIKHRAPKLMRNLGFEWLWRVIIEPSRIKRIISAVIVFPLIVISDTLKHRRFIKALKSVFSEIIKQTLGL